MPKTEASASTASVFYFERNARSTTAMLAISAWLVGLAVLTVVAQIKLWLMTALALPLAPALWELWQNPRSWVRLDDQQFIWNSPHASGEIALAQIAHVDMITRWDLSIRMILHTQRGTDHTLPPDVTPPRKMMEAALAARNIATKQHHFTVF